MLGMAMRVGPPHIDSQNADRIGLPRIEYAG